MRYGKYSDKNLILYRAAIELWSSTTVANTAFLCIRNYGELFGQAPADQVITYCIGRVVIGTALPLPIPITYTNTNAGNKVELSLSSRMDAVDIVKFQFAVKQFNDGKTSPGITSLTFLVQVLNAGFQAIDATLAGQVAQKLAGVVTLSDVKRALRTLRHVCPLMDPVKFGRFEKKLDFTAYLPRPTLMLEEQRTHFKQGDQGKTKNEDTRLLQPVSSAMRRPEKFEFHEFFGQAEADAKPTQPAKGASPLPKYQSLSDIPRVCAYAYRGDGRDPFAIQKAGGLLSHVTRSDMFVFKKGSKVTTDLQPVASLDQKVAPPQVVNLLNLSPAEKAMTPTVEVRKKGVWWLISYAPASPQQSYPNRFVVIKNGQALDIYQQYIEEVTQKPVVDLATDIDANLGYRTDIDAKGRPTRTRLTNEPVVLGSDGRPTTAGAQKYREEVAAFYLNMNLYTMKETFKGFISTTTSMAIAKCFGNLYSPLVDADGYLYALRCVGGFLLPSSDPDFEAGRTQQLMNPKQICPFINFYEQEIAMPGAIWWEHVVGFRVNRCTTQGQFLSGPVFLSNALKQQDPDAFNALFEQFSGKGQGPGKLIEPSYDPTKGYQFVSNAAQLVGQGSLYVI